MSKSKRVAYLREVELKYKIKKVESEIIGRVASDPKAVVALFADLQNEAKEKLIAVNLDAKNKILCFEVVAIGSVSAIHLRPIEVFRTSIPLNAYGLIIVHNHPSGDPKPSRDDLEFTQKLKRISDDLGLILFDHIIVGFESYYSFAEEGEL
jgi:DNA repair protein RadC